MLFSHLYISSDIYWTILHNKFINRTQTHTQKGEEIFKNYFLPFWPILILILVSLVSKDKFLLFSTLYHSNGAYMMCGNLNFKL